MKVGFTGTRHGMTGLQSAAVSTLLDKLFPTEVHHGDCIGADEQFHGLAFESNGERVRRMGHPPTSERFRAFCEFDESFELAPYLTRNHDIVDETEVLIAAPWGFVENQHSGTWATVRYARRLGRKIYLVFSDGTVKEEGTDA